MRSTLRILGRFGGLLEKVDVATDSMRLLNAVMYKCGSNLVELTFSRVYGCDRAIKKENIAKFKNLKSLCFGISMDYRTIDPTCIEQKLEYLDHYGIFNRNMKLGNFETAQLKSLGLTQDAGIFPLTVNVIRFSDQNLLQLDIVRYSGRL